MLVSENQDVILGPPGCGKTTTILNSIDKLMESGEDPSRIAFVSFTRKAITEAVDRACTKFNLPKSRFPLFKTIHATCFANLGISKKDVMSREHYKELGEWLGYRFEGTWDESEGIPVGSEMGDKLLFLDNLARITKRPLRELWEDNYEDCDWSELEDFQNKYQDFKSSNYIMDFTDMLYAYIAMCDPSTANYAFVDEAQDLSPIQWDVLKHAYGNVRKTTIVGDDDQAIYRWSGADVRSFLSLGGRRRTLGQSYRLPRKVHSFAINIVSKIGHRFDKEFRPRDAEGIVDYSTWLSTLELDTEQSQMFLVRNVYLLNRVTEYLEELGVPYIGKNGYSSVSGKDVSAIYATEKLRKHQAITGKEVKILYDKLRTGYYLKHGFKTKVQLLNDDDLFTFDQLNKQHGLSDLSVWYNMLQGLNERTISYYRAILGNGYNLTHTPTCSVSTIHAAKGGEADHVIVLSDMAAKSYDEYVKQPDDERRVAYVAVTRAKERLTIVEEQGKLGFPYYSEGAIE